MTNDAQRVKQITRQIELALSREGIAILLESGVGVKIEVHVPANPERPTRINFTVSDLQDLKLST